MSTLRPSQIRQVLHESFRSDTDFEAFCLDYFPQVSRRFSSGMDRLSKENLLLQIVEPNELVAALREIDSIAVVRALNPFAAPAVTPKAASSVAPATRSAPIESRPANLSAARDTGTTPKLKISYVTDDKAFAESLNSHLAPLRIAGVLEVELAPVISPNVAMRTIGKDDSADWKFAPDAIVVLLSKHYFNDPLAGERLRRLVDYQRHGVPLILVAAGTVAWEKTPLASAGPALPQGRILSGPNDDTGWMEVFTAIEQAIQFPNTSRRAPPVIAAPETASSPSADPPQPRPEPVSTIRQLDDIFTLGGLPGVTYVQPAEHSLILRSLRNPRIVLVVEGPAGVGKSTAVELALRDLRAKDIINLKAGTPADCRRLRKIIDSDSLTSEQLVVDEFHLLEPSIQKKDPELQRDLALMAKRHIDEGRKSKVTLIGINPIGDSLIAALPDLASRYQPIRLGRQPDEKIDELISQGEAAANIEFLHRPTFIGAAQGSLALAQWLCHEAASRAGLEETARIRQVIDVKPSDVISGIHESLAPRFRPLLVKFAGWDAQTPPRGSTLLLLWHLHRAPKGYVVVDEIRNQYADQPDRAAAFAWLLSSKLATLFDEIPALRKLLFFNRTTGILSAEDPMLWFYLANLEAQGWQEFARVSGNTPVSFDLTHGFTFPATSPPAMSQPSPVVLHHKSAQFVVVHLSDLHFGTNEQAEVWASQLGADLKIECGYTQIGALVLSGDIGSRAEASEYAAAQHFLRHLGKEIPLLGNQIVIVPGNHDVSWAQTQEAYVSYPRARYQKLVSQKAKPPLVVGRYFEKSPASDYIEVLENDSEYGRRWQPFADFYQGVRAQAYPMDPADQYTLDYFEAAGVLVLGLNSAWQTDHLFPGRVNIPDLAVTRALSSVSHTQAYRECRHKVVVLHHPLDGADADAPARDHDFLNRLAQAGFQIVLHGHIHRADDKLFYVYREEQGVHILGAGTFGAVDHQDRPPGVPLHYQILELHDDKIRVRSRRRPSPGGTWEPDHRYKTKPGKPNADEVWLPLGPAIP